jgi:hypothetical protein
MRIIQRTRSKWCSVSELAVDWGFHQVADGADGQNARVHGRDLFDVLAQIVTDGCFVLCGDGGQ